MQPTFELDEDGKHVHWFHDCPFHGNIRPEAVLPLGENNWTLVSSDPITITPSILCMACKCHGFITEGRWVSA